MITTVTLALGLVSALLSYLIIAVGFIWPNSGGLAALVLIIPIAWTGFNIVLSPDANSSSSALIIRRALLIWTVQFFALAPAGILHSRRIAQSTADLFAIGAPTAMLLNMGTYTAIGLFCGLACLGSYGLLRLFSREWAQESSRK